MRVQFDLGPLKAELNRMQRARIPSAAALALTDTGQDVKAAVLAEMPSRFTIRRSWILQGLRVIPASSTSLSVTVYHKDAFMGLQETGGTKASIHKRVFEWGDYLAIPVDARRSKSDIVAQKDWPKNLVDPFVLTAKDGRKYLAVHSLGGGGRKVSVRKARGQNRRVSGSRLMYLLVDKVAVPDRLTLHETGPRVAAERWPINFANRMNAPSSA
jgi:hypothetical protein